MIWPFTLLGNRLERQRKKFAAQSESPLMRDFFTAPLLPKQQDWREQTIVALDLETTGLNPDQDKILSMGLVEIRRGVIHLDSQWHRIVNVGSAVPEESAIIHHITDDLIAEGEALEQLLPQLLQRLAGKVMLVHYAHIEQEFLNAACLKLYGTPFLIQTIDTLQLAHRQMARRNHTIQSGALRLFNLRKMYGLPEYKAHNALYDALATAELFLAMSAENAPQGRQPLKDYLNGD